MRLLSVAVLSLAMIASATPAVANCVDPSLDSALMTTSVGGSALSPSAPHPILQRTVVAAGPRIYLRDLTTLAPIGTSLLLSGAVEGAPNPVRMDNGSYGAFVVQSDGFVSRINPEGANPTLDWETDLRRTGCPDDSLSAVPSVHLRRYASASFQSRYTTDLLYVATRYDIDCLSGNTNNRVYALNAETGAVVWVFNEGGDFDLDATFQAPFLDYATDRLLVGTDRSAYPTQKSLWSIDLISGAKSWATSVGQIYSSPQVRGNRAYIATLFGEIKAISTSDGATIWSLSNGGIPISTNIFREFRSPFGEVITSVDYNGDIWMVLDNGATGHSMWTASLVDPVTGVPTRASSRVATDPGNGKLYAGAEDGQVYQLNIVDGEVEATRTVSSGSAVGGASFVFEGADVNMVAGAANGTLVKLCAPWAAEALMSPLQPNCTLDSQCAPLDPNPTSCSQWACVSGVCVAAPSVSDGTACLSDGNPNTENEVCNAGFCAGTSECERQPGSCSCEDASGTTVNRELQVTQGSCSISPPTGSGIDPLTWCGQEVSALVSQSDCMAHGSGAQTAVWIHLLDQNRQPFAIAPGSGSVEMTISGGAGTPPQILMPGTMAPVTGTTASLAAGTVVASPSRVGTYYMYLGAQSASATPSGATPWTISANVVLNEGAGCIDTVDDGQLLSTQLTMGHISTQACPLSAADAPTGSLQVRVTESGVGQIAAPVQVGYSSELAFAQTFEESILGTASGGTASQTDATGSVVFNDFGGHLNGAIPVAATCPGGTLGDAKTQTVMASSSSVEIALSCAPPGHITFQTSDIYRIEATAGATPVNISTLLDAIDTGAGDAYPAVSRNGQWMTLVTERFDPACQGWSCLAVVNPDFTVGVVPWIGGNQIHPEGRTAISNDGNMLVYFDDGPSHQSDLWVTTRSTGGPWSTPLNLTASVSPHSYNVQPVLSHDQTRVLFDCGPIAWGQNGTGVCEIAVDGTGFVQHVHPVNDNPFGGGPDQQARSADYAPDGSIVFEASWDAEQLWRLTLPAGTLSQIIPEHSNDNSPCVLPNGKIASLWLPTSPHELNLTEADGSSSVIILPGVDVADIGMSCHD